MEKKLFVTSRELVRVVLICTALSGVNGLVKKEDIESSLSIIHEVSTKSLGTLCVTEQFRSLTVPLDTLRFESARQKADLAATLLHELGVAQGHDRPGTCILNSTTPKRGCSNNKSRPLWSPRT